MSDGSANVVDIARRLRPISAAAVRLLAGALLCYIFVVVLMVAAAQTDIAKKLDAGDYSSSYAAYKTKTAAARVDLEPLRKRITRLSAEIRRADNAQQFLGGRYNNLELPIRSVMQTLGGQSATCDLPALADLSPATIGNTIRLVSQCAEERTVPDDIKAHVAKNLASQDELISVAGQWVKVSNDLEQMKSELAENQESAKTIEDDADKYGRIFASTSVMANSWLVFGDFLIQFPPVMMQFILALVSGLFGSLLVMLVVIVYPKNDIGIGTIGGNFGERILLGGLIAVCVLIVLGGGTAVLGAGAAFSAGEANFQAISAICVLAGMFSDRVADWLSDRATAFYSQKGTQGSTHLPAGDWGAKSP